MDLEGIMDMDAENVDLAFERGPVLAVVRMDDATRRNDDSKADGDGAPGKGTDCPRMLREAASHGVAVRV
jgi:hypothetical protein